MMTEHFRAATPGVHDKLFLNSAGASLMPDVVVENIKAYLNEEAKTGGYQLADAKAEEINAFYNEAAKLINSAPHNIAFAANATDGYSRALSAIPFKENDVIITSDDDYASNHIHFISLQKRYNIKVFRIRNLENGELDIIHFKELIEHYHPKLVAITHIPTNSGLIQNVEAIGELCRQHQIIYLLDACQSVGQIPVDVKKIQCDFLSTTGRKFLRGPRGTGFLFVSDRLLNAAYIPLYIDLRGAVWTENDHYTIIKSAKRFETWELPYALLMGYKAALNYANAIGMENVARYNKQLMKQLRENLRSIPGLSLFDKGTKTGSILTFRKEGVSLAETKNTLDAHRVYYSVTQRESALIDFDKKGIDWAIRLSPHYFNTFEEMDKAAEIINAL